MKLSGSWTNQKYSYVKHQHNLSGALWPSFYEHVANGACHFGKNDPGDFSQHDHSHTKQFWTVTPNAGRCTDSSHLHTVNWVHNTVFTDACCRTRQHVSRNGTALRQAFIIVIRHVRSTKRVLWTVYMKFSQWEKSAMTSNMKIFPSNSGETCHQTSLTIDHASGRARSQTENWTVSVDYLSLCTVNHKIYSMNFRNQATCWYFLLNWLIMSFLASKATKLQLVRN